MILKHNSGRVLRFNQINWGHEYTKVLLRLNKSLSELASISKFCTEGCTVATDIYATLNFQKARLL